MLMSLLKDFKRKVLKRQSIIFFNFNEKSFCPRFLKFLFIFKDSKIFLSFNFYFLNIYEKKVLSNKFLKNSQTKVTCNRPNSQAVNAPQKKASWKSPTKTFKFIAPATMRRIQLIMNVCFLFTFSREFSFSLNKKFF